MNKVKPKRTALNIGEVLPNGLDYPDYQRIVAAHGNMLYPTPEHLASAISSYFESLVTRAKRGRIIERQAPSVAGLRLHLGMVSSDTLARYRKMDGFKDAIDAAYLVIEAFHETKLAYGAATGSLGWLRHWCDYLSDPETKLSINTGPVIAEINWGDPGNNPNIEDNTEGENSAKTDEA